MPTENAKNISNMVDQILCDDSQTHERLQSIGNLLESMQELELAKAVQMRLIDLAQETNMAGRLARLAKIYEKQGKIYDAEPVLKRAISLREKLCDTSTEAIASREHLASLYVDQGKYEDAEKLFVSCLEQRKACSGDSLSPSRAASLQGLGKLLLAKEQFQEAESQLRQALSLQQELSDGPSKDVAISLSLELIAACARKLGRNEEALAVYQEVLEIRHRAHGKEHPDVATTLREIAFTVSKLGDYAKAEKLYGEALHLYDRFFAGDHPETTMLKRQLSFCRSMR